MLRTALFVAALCMIWLAWGVWIVIVLAVFMIIFSLYASEEDKSPGPFLMKEIYMLAVNLAGIYAVSLFWNEPAYTGTAVIIAVFLYVTDLKDGEL